MSQTNIFLNGQELAQAAAELAVTELNAAITTHGMAVWVLAGGTSPMAAYAILAERYKNALDWTKVTVLLGDERCVPVDHPDSNWGQIQPYLDKLGIPEANQLRPKTELTPQKAAKAYDKLVQMLPRLDHVWLGVGEDGHTLSLFPGRTSPANTWVMPVHDSPKPPADRISLTLQALVGARSCAIMAAGQGKAAVVARALKGDTQLPIAQAAEAVESRGGRVVWLLDQAAHS